MKNRKYKLLPVLVLTLALIGLLAATTLTAFADDQGSDATQFSLTNFPTVMPSVGASNSINSYIPLRKDSGLALSWPMIGSGTNSVTLFVTVDGTNYATTPWATLSNLTTTAAITNTVTTNWNANQLRGYKGMLVNNLTNGAGATTNFGIYVRRPN